MQDRIAHRPPPYPWIYVLWSLNRPLSYPGMRRILPPLQASTSKILDRLDLHRALQEHMGDIYAYAGADGGRKVDQPRCD